MIFDTLIRCTLCAIIVLVGVLFVRALSTPPATPEPKPVHVEVHSYGCHLTELYP